MSAIRSFLGRSPVTTFVVIAFAWTWAFTALGSISLAFSLVALFGPAVAAVVATAAEGTYETLRRRITDWRQHVSWYALALAIPFGVAAIARLLLMLGGQAPEGEPFHVVAYDFGIKYYILRYLAALGCRVTVVPAGTRADDVLALAPDGIFLSNGPGDPAALPAIVGEVRRLVGAAPVFGICLGHQLLGLAFGGRTFKLKFGHRGGNQPVKNLRTGRIEISSHNHGFAVDPATLPANVRVTHTSLFDGSLQGFALTDRPAFCFQGHPEASPGPLDIGYLFQRFAALMQEAR